MVASSPDRPAGGALWRPFIQGFPSHLGNHQPSLTPKVHHTCLLVWPPHPYPLTFLSLPCSPGKPLPVSPERPSFYDLPGA